MRVRVRVRVRPSKRRGKKKRRLSVFSNAKVFQRDSVRGCGMAARYSLNNITEVTRVASVFMPLPI